MAVNLAPAHPSGLALRNPLAAAAGTFGYGIEYARLVDIQRLGAIFSKGTTLRPRRGAPPPRVVETPAGMLNAVGLQNPGVDAVVREKAPIWARWDVPVVVNVAGESIDDYVQVAQALEGAPGVAAIELNISCPNVAQGGMIFGCEPDLAAAVTREVRAACSLPLVVKLTPNVTDIRPVAAAVEEAGADAVTVINTVLGMAIDVERRVPYLGNRTGGLSGPAIKPIAVRMVYQVAQTVSIPIIGAGGVLRVEDVLEFLLAGATAVQVGTGTFADPAALPRLLDDLAHWLTRHGVRDIHELIGAALPDH
ncbi:MAG TPA: dihydroorotate dehydrogenase [Chloroflexota bacterium]|nr:dihydroorotate dehydrogenase [Chloroflexota bacterium]